MSMPSSSPPATGKLIVFTGPSGVGKGTLLKALLAAHPELYLSISVTTRSPRPGEVDGQHYYFLDREEFDRWVARGELLEWAEFAGNCYGTPRSAVTHHIEQGHWVVLEIELEGARQVRRTFPEAFQIFVLPPSLAELEHRLRSRGQDSEEAIVRRLQRASEEIAAAAEFDVQIINGDLARTLQELEQILFPSAL